MSKEDTIDISPKAPLNVYPEYVPTRPVDDRDRLIAKKFAIPSCASDLVDFFFNKEEQDFIADTPDEFDADTLDKEFLESLFAHGIISKTDDTGTRYRLSDFYGFLDVFAVTRTSVYHTLSRAKRKEIDDWYFDSYVSSLDPDLTKRPTADVVKTLDEMMDFIDSLPDNLYLSYCDCKSLSGDCNLPSHTCISFAPGINSFAARGASQKVSYDEAKEVIRKADEAGLVHTVSDHGICNCCDDCCYLFRSQKIRKSTGFWPASPHIISFDADKCISCGKCTTRCHFGVFEKKDGKITADNTGCIGCGLCANTCPAGALRLTDRPPIRA